MNERMLELLAILGDLVACDTQNPPRDIGVDSGVFECVKHWLGEDFTYSCQDFGKGRVNLLAKRGKPRRLFNVHLDTVPAGEEWTKPPLQLTVETERVFGRGVCDIKGAAACLMAAASTARDAAILFSTDEEGAESCCISEFCKSDLVEPYDDFVVAEPTEGQAVVGHRGYLSMSGRFKGRSGHTSQHELLSRSANHRAANWVANALEQVEELENRQLGGESTCFNIGRIDGGIKNNMIADQCLVTWSARMPGGYLNQLLKDCLLNRQGDEVTWETTFDGGSFPCDPESREQAISLCQKQSLAISEDVDFWTEAAIFSETGKPTIVLGPGDIAQAHAANEWVSIEQLEKCAKIYASLMS